MSSEAFLHRLVVRFHEIDRAGIAYFTRAYEYCHAAFEEMLVAALGFLTASMLRPTTSPAAMVAVHVSTDELVTHELNEMFLVCCALKHMHDPCA